LATDEQLEPSPIRVRKFEAGPNAETPRYWFDDDPFMTHFFNAISSMFPEGERFFIRAVRNFKDDIATPELAAQVSAFVHQEAQHFKVHDDHVALLEAQGYSVLSTYNRLAERGLKWTSEKLPRFALASTVGTEHITAVLADQVLRHEERWLAPMVPEMRRLWRWHAIEESEHKAVAFDVYQECLEQGRLSGLWMRRLAMLEVIVFFFAETFVRHSVLLIKDRQLTPRVLWRGARLLWGKGGLVRSFHPRLWHFFKRDFHPWQHNNAQLVEDSLLELRRDGLEFAA